MKKYSSYLQYLLPQRTITILFGKLAGSKNPKIKNMIIRWFIKRYQVDLTAAREPQWESYASFSDFFIRQLKTELRPIDQDPKAIVSPVDGTVAQIGVIAKGQLLQAKRFYFSLETLLGDADKAQAFQEGTFGTFYLAPKDYHRVHMPCDGLLTESIYIPGKLFSVNKLTSEVVPNLYSRNERLILFFETAFGPMVLIFVGAMIVGNIKPSWTHEAIRASTKEKKTISPPIQFKKGAELGYFTLGSTVILIFPQNSVTWLAATETDNAVYYGQKIANVTGQS